jgi:hypothetical protein
MISDDEARRLGFAINFSAQQWSDLAVSLRPVGFGSHDRRDVFFYILDLVDGSLLRERLQKVQSLRDRSDLWERMERGLAQALEAMSELGFAQMQMFIDESGPPLQPKDDPRHALLVIERWKQSARNTWELERDKQYRSIAGWPRRALFRELTLLWAQLGGKPSRAETCDQNGRRIYGGAFTRFLRAATAPLGQKAINPASIKNLVRWWKMAEVAPGSWVIPDYGSGKRLTWD